VEKMKAILGMPNEAKGYNDETVGKWETINRENGAH